MGKPRLIILIRHAQSEGNKNREIHQTVPDHRVKLTPEGKKQAFEAGRKLRALLRPDDTLHFYTSPYRRTRETTEGILSSLTSDDPTPSPFPRHTIKVYEEPRLREQDFGNFQPDSKEMSRMWHERAEYGHFFYRIPNGESAADAYDRVSGFNETLWRSFGEDDFASVCVLVTHGLMTRVFLMKWYHWSVEYFEDLRNINHCEFIVMQKDRENGKYVLKNQLRTWTQYKLELERAEAAQSSAAGSPVPPRKHWGDQNDDTRNRPVMRPQRQNTADLFREDGSSSLQQLDAALSRKTSAARRDPGPPPRKLGPAIVEDAEHERRAEAAIAAASVPQPDPLGPPKTPPDDHDDTIDSPEFQQVLMPTTSPSRATHFAGSSKRKKPFPPAPFSPTQLAVIRAGRDGGGSRSGTGSRAGSSSGSDADSADAPPAAAAARARVLSADEEERARQFRPPRSMARALLGELTSPDERGAAGGPAMADALGDQSDMEEEPLDEEYQATRTAEGGFEGSVR